MCGRYVDPNESALERFWHHGARGRQWWDKPYEPRYNVAPTLPSLSFNARSEEAAEKPMWRESLARQRCLKLIQAARGDLDGYPVSTRVNSARNDEEGLMAEEGVVCNVNRG